MAASKSSRKSQTGASRKKAPSRQNRSSSASSGRNDSTRYKRSHVAARPSDPSAALPISKSSTPAVSLHGTQAQKYQPQWANYSDQQLLDMRICDLELDFEQTALVDFRDQLYTELKDRGLKLKPHCWLSDDWFSPDGIPGIAVPFFMAHRRLMRLERAQMLEVEGGTKDWCLQILRHEAGHALDTAFRLHRRKGYREVFGNYSDPYPETYRPRPRSKKYVLHLAPWYAQSHPAEDFAETFAVWLTPGSRWRKDYQGWPALKKLEYVDHLMESIRGQAPRVASKAKIDPVHRIRRTLREHYQQRQATYCIHEPSVFDDDLRRLFSTTKPADSASGRARTAAAFMQRHRRELCQTIAHWSGEYRYNINQVIREMIERCRLLKLYVDGDEHQVKQDLLILLTMHTMNYLHAGHRVAL